jgi:GxxExxY protein
MLENELSYQIRGAIFEVYKNLGPGLLESVYESALLRELSAQKLQAKGQVHLPVFYKNAPLDLHFRIDILVENKVLIEIKSVERLTEVHHKQVLTYLKLSGLKLGLLVNFNDINVNHAIHRKVNNL